MKAKCEAAHRQFWARSHVSHLLHYYFTGDVFEGTVGKTQLKNRFLLYCKITIRSGICFLELEEVTPGEDGVYACLAENAYGQDNRTVGLSVMCEWPPCVHTPLALELRSRDYGGKGRRPGWGGTGLAQGVSGTEQRWR